MPPKCPKCNKYYRMMFHGVWACFCEDKPKEVKKAKTLSKKFFKALKEIDNYETSLKVSLLSNREIMLDYCQASSTNLFSGDINSAKKYLLEVEEYKHKIAVLQARIDSLQFAKEALRKQS